MSLEIVVAIVQVITTAAVAVVGLLLSQRWRESDQRRQDLQRSSEARKTVAAILKDLTSGEVEDARNLVGTVRYGSFGGGKPTVRA